jgi:hypothetical protein
MASSLAWIPVELVGGPLDGQVLSVAHDEPVVIIQTSYGPQRYVWVREDDGSWYLRDAGAV